MKRSKWIALAGAALAVALATAGTAAGASRHHGGGTYTVTPLVSDQAGAAAKVDPNLVNGWGISAGPAATPPPGGSPTTAPNTSTLYDAPARAPSPCPLVVKVPGGPTGTVFYGGTGFLVPNGSATAPANVPAKFMFATQSGTIQGWPPGTTSTVTGFDGSKWRASLHRPGDLRRLAVRGRLPQRARRHHRQHWKHVKKPGAFTDWKLPKGYSPFGIQAAGGYIFVQYA